MNKALFNLDYNGVLVTKLYALDILFLAPSEDVTANTYWTVVGCMLYSKESLLDKFGPMVLLLKNASDSYEMKTYV